MTFKAFTLGATMLALAACGDNGQNPANLGATTMMMGPADAMAAERNYFQFLTQVEKYNLKDGTLVLTANDGKTMTFKQVYADAVPDDTVVTEETETVVVDAPVATK